jgi:hypothetical protein
VLLFEVDSAPSSDELEQAIATIERHLARRGDRETELSGSADLETRRAAARVGERPGDGAARAQSLLPGSLSSSSTSGLRTASAASTPTAGSASLAVTNQIHLGAASDVFKAGSVFLWDDADGNSALGRNALASVSGDATYNTALGREALENTTGGGSSFSGSSNTAVGDRALRSNTTGSNNTANGAFALRHNLTGSGNTAVGNTAGYFTTGSSNILINNFGVAGESNVLRIGQATGTGNSQLDKAFIHGIVGRTTANANAIPVLIDSAGQLGTVSSSRALKQDIQDVGVLADRLLELRPVAFRFKQHVATDPDTPLQFGLIAEQVAEVFPELVVNDEAGKPQTVKYHLLSSLLLGELQKQHGEIQKQHGELEELRSRLAAIESRSGRAKRSRGGGDLGRGER